MVKHAVSQFPDFFDPCLHFVSCAPALWCPGQGGFQERRPGPCAPLVCSM